MRIYTAGKMRGMPLNNFPMFDEADRLLRAEGWYVVNPAAMDREHGITEATTGLTNEQLRYVFANDFHELCYCDAIAMLPGWEASTGARIEWRIAVMLGLTVFYLDMDGDMPRPAEVELELLTGSDIQ